MEKEITWCPFSIAQMILPKTYGFSFDKFILDNKNMLGGNKKSNDDSLRLRVNIVRDAISSMSLDLKEKL